MVVIQHYSNLVITVFISQEEHWIEVVKYNGISTKQALVNLNQEFNLAINKVKLCWLHGFDKLEEKQLQKLESVELGDLELKFYSSHASFNDNINLGFSFFGSPALINYPKDIQYSSWYVSDQVGMIYSDVIDWQHIENIQCSRLSDLLILLGFDLYCHGGIVVSDPILSEMGLSSYEPKQLRKSDYLLLKNRGTLRQKVFYAIKFPSFIGIVNFLIGKRLDCIVSQERIERYYSVDFNEVEVNESYDVIIPTIGRAKYLEKVLEDLNQQSLIPNNVIIIEQVLQEPFETELHFLVETQYKFGIIHKVINQPGACNARNIALDLVTADWVFFADDDIRIEQEIVEKVISSMIHFSIKALTMMVYLREEEKSRNRYWKVWESFGSGCSIVKKEAIVNLKFDTALEFGYGEDTDFGYAIRNLGNTIYYTDTIAIKHLKAPIGGFRYKHNFPWTSENPMPRPSPTVLYSIVKNQSKIQQTGYKWNYLIHRIISNPLDINKIRSEWRKSKYWLEVLQRG